MNQRRNDMKDATPEEINNAIADMCGSHIGYATGVITNKEERIYAFPWLDAPSLTPNFYGDLNACALFEAVLTPKEKAVYGDVLNNIIQAFDNDYYTGWSGSTNFTFCEAITAIATATAPQRCEAFLKVKGK
jgi:hypothetical protein